MNFLPKFKINNEYSSGTKTWLINFDDGNISDFIDGQDALKQSIYFILSCCKYKYPIFSFDFGIDMDLIFYNNEKKSDNYIKKSITEALLVDDRILDVVDFKFKYYNTYLIIEFNIICVDTQFSISYKFDKENQ